jgi:para-aminobenzoate synthetase component 1
MTIAKHFATEHEADLFLTGPGFSNDAINYICLQPITEMILTDKIGKDDVALYVFSDSLPTFGFLSYNLGEAIRNIKRPAASEFPPGYLKKYNSIIKYNHADNQMEIMSNNETELAEIKAELDQIDYDVQDKSGKSKQDHIKPSMTKEEYIRGVVTAIELIRNGNIYQLNLAIKYQTIIENLEPEILFFDLYKNHPAPYYCYYRCGDYHMLSTSPELFLRVRDGNVLSRPIKGTLHFEKYDKSLNSKLTDSPKEAAELSMIVDMVRNDIGHNCETGSIKVNNHKSTFVVDRLIQMYSDVVGKLKGERTVLDLLWDAFPGASITGCPKLAAMKYIADLEPPRRNAYCGSFVIIHDEKNLDSSIAIRTADYDADSGEFAFYAGSGIVADSDPEKEFEETTAKAEKFLKYFQ